MKDRKAYKPTSPCYVYDSVDIPPNQAQQTNGKGTQQTRSQNTLPIYPCKYGGKMPVERELVQNARTDCYSRGTNQQRTRNNQKRHQKSIFSPDNIADSPAAPAWTRFIKPIRRFFRQIIEHRRGKTLVSFLRHGRCLDHRRDAVAPVADCSLPLALPPPLSSQRRAPRKTRGRAGKQRSNQGKPNQAKAKLAETAI